MGLTFDTGALIALERNRLRALRFIRLASEKNEKIVVPSVALAEWWRGRSDKTERILSMMEVEPISETLAKLAGEALAQVAKGPSVVDAIVMASAAQRGDVVLTSDVADLAALRGAFPNVRVLGV